MSQKLSGVLGSLTEEQALSVWKALSQWVENEACGDDQSPEYAACAKIVDELDEAVSLLADDARR